MSEGLELEQIKRIVEAALLATEEPLTVDRLVKLFARGELEVEQKRTRIREALKAIEADVQGHGYELKRVASGYRFQVRQDLSEWVSRLWDEKPPRYSRALLETLALIAYKQPVTRGDIEQVRGVSVSQNIMRTLLERGWIRVVGQREVPGRPAMYGSTRGDRKAQVSCPRKTLGPFNGGALRLGPAGLEIGIAEGLETGLSAMRLFEVPVWCACQRRRKPHDKKGFEPHDQRENRKAAEDAGGTWVWFAPGVGAVDWFRTNCRQWPAGPHRSAGNGQRSYSG